MLTSVPRVNVKRFSNFLKLVNFQSRLQVFLLNTKSIPFWSPVDYVCLGLFSVVNNATFCLLTVVVLQGVCGNVSASPV